MNAATLQRMTALETANARRYAGATVRREIAAQSMQDGMERVAVLLHSPSDAIGALRLDDLLKSIRRLGEGKVARLLLMADGFNPARRHVRIRDLTARERAAVILVLRKAAS